MIQEIAVAAKFLAAHANADHQEAFRVALCSALAERLAGHWYTDMPERGSAYRAVSVFAGSPDPLLRRAAAAAAMPPAALAAALPADLTLWVDPFFVAYRQGEHGFVLPLWDPHGQHKLPAHAHAHHAHHAALSHSHPAAQHPHALAHHGLQALSALGSPGAAASAAAASPPLALVGRKSPPVSIKPPSPKNRTSSVTSTLSSSASLSSASLASSASSSAASSAAASPSPSPSPPLAVAAAPFPHKALGVDGAMHHHHTFVLAA
ncbi:transducer of ERBB2 [Polyrhizophydium stewartii]|uniref:Transducer of ERBB2 n=1 Tax=Polyrhizophydium stewartii TaxID=2732419 RepID=A0ABR4N2G7_9FUNG